MGLGAALLAILTGVIVKGAVMILVGWLLVDLGRPLFRPAKPRRLRVLPEKRDHARVLFASLCLFAVSELVCAVEGWILRHAAPETSIPHALLSALGMGLFGVWLYDLVDDGILRFGRPGCGARKICQTCTVAQEEGCKMRRVALLGAAFLALGALSPLFVSIAPVATDLRRFELPFSALNAWHDERLVPFLRARVEGYSPGGEAYTMGPVELFVELRLAPALAALIGVASAWRFRRGDLERGARLAAFSAGVLAYVLLEVVAYRATADVLLGSLIHEVAELWFLIFTAELLRRTYPPERAAAAT